MSLTSRPPQSASRERAGVDSLYRGSARLGAISCLNTHETNHVFGGRPYQLEAASSTGSSVGALFHGTRSVGLHSPSDYEWPPDRSNHIRTSGRKKAYVIITSGCPGMPNIYIKLQLGSGFVIGRSFH